MSNDIEIHGFCEERFGPVKQVFAEHFKTGQDVGASFAATIDGKFVIDIWAGFADAAKTRQWEKDTIVNVYSTTKVMAALCIHILIDRKLIDLDAPVAKYWPEFAQAGKENIPVRYLLSHNSGMAGYDDKITLEDLYDWELIVTKLAAQEPWWEPGTRSGYHTTSFGYLLGELVRRVTGKTLGTFFREEVAVPLNIDFHIGFSEELDHRVADLIPLKRSMLYRVMTSKLIKFLGRNNLLVKSSFNPVVTAEDTHTRAWKAAEIPASNGHGNARSIARVGAILACEGELDDVRVLSTSTVENSIKEQSYGKDLVSIKIIRWGLGWALTCEEDPIGPNPRAFTWGGLGGSKLVMDLDARMSAAYAMNKMFFSLKGKPRAEKLMKTLYECLYPE